MSANRLLSVREIAHQLGISRNLAGTMIASGQLPSIPSGKRRKVPQSALTDFLRSASVQPQPAPQARPALRLVNRRTVKAAVEPSELTPAQRILRGVR